MPRAHGNQPASTANNNNLRKDAKSSAPRRNKKAPYRKAPRRPANKNRMVDNKQSNLINSLSRQMYKMQMAAYGSTQQNFHSLERTLIPTRTTPICLDLTDFTSKSIVNNQIVVNGARCFQAQSASPYYNKCSNWRTSTVIANNPYWKAQNQDSPDTGKYLAMQAAYFVDIRGNANLDNTRIRFDLVSQKPEGIVPQAVNNYANVLPFTLQYLTHLAEPHINRINPVYFKKYWSKTIFINSQPSGTSGVKATTANIQRFSFKIKPNKVCKQVETNPQVGDVPIVDEATGDIELQAEIEGGNFGPFNVPATQPLWLIISTDDAVATVGDAVEIRMSRRITYRDHVGASNL